MAIRGIVFDIGGVLEYTAHHNVMGVDKAWEQKLNLQPGEMAQRLEAVWRAGSIGTISEAEVCKRIGEIMAMSVEQVNAYMEDVWTEYLGTLNEELATYFKNLRPQYKTAILSNSFVGAREREQAAYQFEDICDFIIYSHEVGIAKPDRRIYEMTCERLGLKPEEVIFLDNVEAVVTPASALGMHGIVFKNNAQAIADIEACIKANANI